MTSRAPFAAVLAGVIALSTATLVSQATNAHADADAHAGWSGGRPPECDPEGASNVWERVKAPELHTYCARLAEGAAFFADFGPVMTAVPSTNPASMRAAIQAADDAEASVAGHAAPHVLRGRALVALSKTSEGVAELERASSLDARALEDPSALLALARGYARSGQMDKARAAYALLLPRSSSLLLSARGAAFFEAGLLSLERAARLPASDASAANDEAFDRFREAMRSSQDALHEAAVGAMALALDRAGRADEVAALFDDHAVASGDAVVAAFDDPRVKSSVATAAAASQAEAMQALAARASGRAGKSSASWRLGPKSAAGGATLRQGTK